MPKKKRKNKKIKVVTKTISRTDQLKERFELVRSRVIRHKKKFAVLGVGLFLLLIISCAGGSKNDHDGFYSASPDTFVQTIEVAGIVEPAERVDLAFEKTGRLVELNVDVNDRIEVGQVLAMLNTSEAEAQQQDARASLSGAYSSYSQYEAMVESAESKKLQLLADLDKEKSILEQLKNGAKPEEITLAESVVANAEKSILDAQENLSKIEAETDTVLNNLYLQIFNAGQDAYSVSNDVITRITGVMFLNPTSRNPQIIFSAQGTYDYTAEFLRKKAFEGIDPLQDHLLTINSESSEEELDIVLSLASESLEATRTMVNGLNTALDNKLNLNDMDFNTYKTATSLASSNLNVAVNNINNLKQLISNQKMSNATNLNVAQSGLNEAENRLATAKSELTLVKAGPTAEEIQTQDSIIQRVEADLSAQDANIKSAKANLSSAGSRIEQAKAQVSKAKAAAEKNVLVAPISGKITARDYSLGEIVQANDPVYRLSSASNHEIIADIPELDIPSVAIGNKAEVYLDPYGEDVMFEAVITEIEPAERIIEGLAKYRITLQFVENDTRIKSGMTANLTIVVAEKEGVLSVPARSVIEQGGKSYLRVDNQDRKYDPSSETVLKLVELGAYSSDGRVEVINGLRASDKVILD